MYIPTPFIDREERSIIENLYNESCALLGDFHMLWVLVYLRGGRFYVHDRKRIHVVHVSFESRHFMVRLEHLKKNISVQIDYKEISESGGEWEASLTKM